jgi:beta-lactamase superfamily II metal-dependent hydrolase
MSKMKIRFYPCGSGEFIVISTASNNHIVIDTGYQGQYEAFLKPFINEEEKIGLLILTHTDEDHIGGIVKLIEVGDEYLLKDKVNQIWFNWSSLRYKQPSDKISVAQGMLLRDKFHELGKLHESDITTETNSITIEDLEIHLLSPSPAKLEKSKVEWKKEEQKKIAAYSDYHITIEDLLKKEFNEDTSVWNGGSIAVLIESEGKKVLLLADAHPSIIIQTLKSEKFGCTPENPIKVDCVKVSHHGSKSNTNYELLKLIDCANWVFCANGTKHGFPHKECISKIIHNRKNENEKTKIIFNHPRPTYNQIFDVDKNAMKKYNFELVHLDQGKYEL